MKVDTLAIGAQRNTITSVEEFNGYLLLSNNEGRNTNKVTGLHPMNVPRYYLSLIDSEAPNDPNRRLCIPGD